MTDTKPESFIKSPGILREDYKVEDLFDTDKFATDFKFKLENAPHRSIIGLIGEYGTGKSTLLHKISQSISKDLWIEFDAWKFPERKELWEGFVLDFARQVDEKSFEDVRKTIDGQQNDDKKTLINTVGDIPIPGFAAIKNLTHFYETSPARRTYEIQDILKNLIEEKAKDKKIYIVVEDIDRSGDAGIFFLETLKYFLQKLEVSTTIKVIVPIANQKFYENSDSYVKCLDIVDFYSPTDVKMDKFVSNVFTDSLTSEPIIKKQLARFFEQMMLIPGMTPRKLKLILRKADLNYINQQSDDQEPDFRMSIMFEASRYIPSKKDSDTTLFDYYKESKNIASNKLFSSFATVVATESELLDYEGKLIDNQQPFKLIPRKDNDVEKYPSTPYIQNQRFGNDHYSWCCDFYLNY